MADRARQLRLIGAPKAKLLDGIAWIRDIAADVIDLVDCVLSELESRHGKIAAQELPLWRDGDALLKRLAKESLTMWVATDRQAVIWFLDRAHDALGMRVAKFSVAREALLRRLEGR